MAIIKCYAKSIYWHMIDGKKDPKFKSPIYGTTVSTGKKVKRGDIIGYVDSTGLSTGNHLHWGLKPCAKDEPANTWYNLEQNNGYYGAIDPRPYLRQRFVFKKNMKFGDENDDVAELQTRLIELGYSIPSIESGKVPKGYYGNQTRVAVFYFQRDYVANKSWSAWIAVWTGFGTYCHELTRNELNKS